MLDIVTLPVNAPDEKSPAAIPVPDNSHHNSVLLATSVVVIVVVIISPSSRTVWDNVTVYVGLNEVSLRVTDTVLPTWVFLPESVNNLIVTVSVPSVRVSSATVCEKLKVLFDIVPDPVNAPEEKSSDVIFVPDNDQ